ncbi:MAG TPA: hypothetical protein VE953_04395 [Terriglobales bacterium]|nr:hypothetical protein [Terriglobales bacterium]
MVSENRGNATDATDPASAIERARYWFEQYRYASEWEARLIQAIRQLSADRVRLPRELP